MNVLPHGFVPAAATATATHSAAMDQCITDTSDGPAQDGRDRPASAHKLLAHKGLEIGQRPSPRHVVNGHRGGEIRVNLVMVVVIFPRELVTNSRRQLNRPRSTSNSARASASR